MEDPNYDSNYCIYCLCDFEAPPVYIRGEPDLHVHRDGDPGSGGNICELMGEWMEFGRWETGRGSQGSMDGWKPDGCTDKPREW